MDQTNTFFVFQKYYFALTCNQKARQFPGYELEPSYLEVSMMTIKFSNLGFEKRSTFTLKMGPTFEYLES